MPRKRQAKLPPFDKYFHYRNSVQSPDVDVEFFHKVYRRHRHTAPIVLREDFCGTFSICCEWVKLNKKHVAHGVDLDLEPLRYGAKHYLSELKPEQAARVHTHNAAVQSRHLPTADIIAALNFSYFIFKTRAALKDYFTRSREGLKSKGLFMIDCLGGSDYQEPHEETSRQKGFRYFWEQMRFNPINSETLFHIHYQRKGEAKRRRVFSYDWRMWSIPELKDLLLEVGFKKVTVYWEGTTRSGEGDGKFIPREVGDSCESWVAYLIAEK